MKKQANELLNTKECNIFIMVIRALTVVMSISKALCEVHLNEISMKGSPGACNGADWIELVNTGPTVDIANYKLCDDKGCEHANAYVFPSETIITVGEYKLLCYNDTFVFGIGSSDTVTLNDPNGLVIDSSGVLGGIGIFNQTWARTPDITGNFRYSNPTPGEPNSNNPTDIVEPLDYISQNRLGDAFFGLTSDGTRSSVQPVVEIHLQMEEFEFFFMIENSSQEVYMDADFTYVSANENFTLSSKVRIRPRGYSTLFVAECLGLKAMPFLIDFDKYDRRQNLFGVSKAYLRNNVLDNSFGLKEWTMHRMLAEFNLPFLRTRHITLTINGEYLGLYLFMEAPDQEHIFARSFPSYNPLEYQLYKVKVFSMGMACQDINWMTSSPCTPSTEPYEWEHGSHIRQTAMQGEFFECLNSFFQIKYGQLVEDNCRAWNIYQSNGKTCGQMQVEEGLVDRDLGTEDGDARMESFIDNNINNRDLASVVDVDQWLKNIAVYAVTQTHDSPLGGGNNWLIANSGDGRGWKIVQYDHNNMASAATVDQCAAELIDWSIAYPIMNGFDYNRFFGPLLCNEEYFSQYLTYVAQFNLIFTDPTLIEEIEALASSLLPYVNQDPLASLWMGMGADFALQLSADAASPYGGWQAPGNPLLAVMRARGESVTSQLQNLEETMCNDPPNCFPEWSSSQCLNRATACTNSGRSSDSIEVTSFILSLLVFLRFF